MNQKIIVIGGGGHGRVILDALDRLGIRPAGILDQDAKKHGSRLDEIEILGDETWLAGQKPAEVRAVNAVGSSKDMTGRAAVSARIERAGFGFFTVIHPSAIVSSRARISDGAQVMAGAIVQTGAEIGANTLVNTGAIVDHDCRIGPNCHIAPGVTLSGGVQIGSETHIGTGASVIQGIRIGSRCTIAAGAVVVRDLPDGAVAMGVPARIRTS